MERQTGQVDRWWKSAVAVADVIIITSLGDENRSDGGDGDNKRILQRVGNNIGSPCYNHFIKQEGNGEVYLTQSRVTLGHTMPRPRNEYCVEHCQQCFIHKSPLVSYYQLYYYDYLLIDDHYHILRSETLLAVADPSDSSQCHIVSPHLLITSVWEPRFTLAN